MFTTSLLAEFDFFGVRRLVAALLLAGKKKR
jgi:hypothetical protein